jgi:hypothetical protein
LIVLNRKNKETGFSTYLKNLPERYGVDLWLAFFFFGLCSQSILDFRFVPLFLKQNKE